MSIDDLSSSDDEDETDPLCAACVAGRIEEAHELLLAGADPDADLQCAFHLDTSQSGGIEFS